MSVSRISGTLAAAATPLRDGGAAVDEDGFEPLARFLIDAGLNGLLALGTTGEGILLSVPERKRVTELFVAGRGREARRRCPLRRADDGRHGRAGGARCGERRQRGGRDRAAVFPARRRCAARPFQSCRTRVRAHAFLRVRVRAVERLRGAPARDRRASRRRAELRRDEGVGRAVGALPALPDRGPRRLRRARVADPPGPRRRGRRRGLGARHRVPGARARGRPQPQRRGHCARGRSSVPRSRASRATPR